MCKASIFPFKKVHVKIISITFALEIQKLGPFLKAYLLFTHPVYLTAMGLGWRSG
jgi:hypothetical protein